MKPLAPALLALAFLPLAAHARAPRMPPAERFVVPPYSEVVAGVRPSLSSVPERLPPLAAGELAAFVVSANGATNVVLCSRESRAAVVQPEGRSDLGHASAAAVYRTARTNAMLLARSGSGGMAVEAASSNLLGVAGKGEIATMGEWAQLSQTRGQGAVAFEAGGQSVAQDRRNAGVETLQTGVEVSGERQTAALSTNDSQAADGPRGPSATAPASRRSRASAPATPARDMPEWEREAVENAARSGLMADRARSDGIYDAQGRALTSDVAVPRPDDVTAFLSWTRTAGALSDLLDRPPGLPARALTPAPGACRAVLQVSAADTNALYHGGEILYSVLLTNPGPETLHDALIVFRLPAHTSGPGFPVEETPSRGFARCFLDDRQELVWRLYRPLGAGESFKTTCTLRLDPWRPQ